MSRVAESKDMERFNDLSRQKYSDQAIFFLNAFWIECGDQAEKIYGYYQGFLTLDSRKEDGCDLDEFYSHKFLETYGETLTALELRNAMRKIDINHDNRMSFLEYLLYRYSQSVEELLIRPQGVALTQELIDALKALALARENIRQAREEDLKLEAIKSEIAAKKSSLEKQSQAGGVKGNKAKQELFALNNEDSTELNAAKLRAEAAVRKADAAVKKAEEAVHKAQSTGEKVAAGLNWFMERELEEAKKYKPRGGIQKADKFKDL